MVSRKPDYSGYLHIAFNPVMAVKMKKNKINPKKIKVGQIADWKYGLITFTIERISKKRLLIHDLSSGWYSAKVTDEQLEEVISGKLSLFQLKWK